MRLRGKGAGALLLIGCLGFWAPVAAAAPANDDFASRESLGAGLPVEVVRSSYGATSEAGEPSPGAPVNGTGHSIWFEWEAPSSGFVTLTLCGSGVGPVVGVYAGTAVDALTEVAGDFASEGPEGSCPGTEWRDATTFRAIAGAKYEIVADGVARFLEEPNSESGQGVFELRLAATPVPVNDDFADAAQLDSEILANGSYTARATGYTWGATKEAGEPAHAGDPGGASVWYSWTAPSSGTYGLSGCGPFGSLLAVYTGGSLPALTPVTGIAPCDRLILLQASGGTTYRIAIDGRFDPMTATAAMGSFSLLIFREPPAPPALGGSSVGSPPLVRKKGPKLETTIRKRVVNVAKRRATFVFRSSRSDSSFQCWLDRRMPTSCRSPKTYEHLSLGRHVFKVYAVDSAGSGDPSPAVASFRIAEATGKSSRR